MTASDDGLAKVLAVAQRYLEVGKADAALLALDRCPEQGLATTEYWWLRGVALLDSQRYDEAAVVIENGLDLDPGDVDLLSLLAKARFRLGSLRSAETVILRALEIAPEWPGYLCQYAEIVAVAGQVDKAEKLLDRAASIDPEFAGLDRVRFMIGDIRGDGDSTVGHLTDLLEADPEDAGALALLAEKRLGEGRPAEAAEYLRRAVELEPEFAIGAEKQIREVLLRGHWFLRPLAPIYKYGPMAVWMGALGAMWIFYALGYLEIAVVIGAVYFLYCVYSWVAPPLVRRYLRRGV